MFGVDADEPKNTLTRLGPLSEAPISCNVGDTEVEVSITDYRARRETGACAQCEWAGVRIKAGQEVVWEQASPGGYDESMFFGGIDVFGASEGGGTMRICPQDLGNGTARKECSWVSF
jgi:hypothetical protein